MFSGFLLRDSSTLQIYLISMAWKSVDSGLLLELDEDIGNYQVRILTK